MITDIADVCHSTNHYMKHLWLYKYQQLTIKRYTMDRVNNNKNTLLSTTN